MSITTAVADHGTAELPQRSRRLVPIAEGWALEHCGIFERDCPGFLLAAMTAKPVWRHAVFSTFAKGDPYDFVERAIGEPFDDDERVVIRTVAGMLLGMRPRQIVETAWGSCPDGLLGAFERIADPLTADHYHGLFRLLSDRAERRRQIALANCGTITDEKLAALLALDPCLAHPKLFARIKTAEQAGIANDVLAVVRGRTVGLTDDHIYRYVGEGDEKASLNGHLKRLAGLITEAPALPFTLDPTQFRHIRSYDDFVEVGLRFRNCLETKFFERAVVGKAAFLEFLPQEAIAVLVRMEGLWMLGKVHAPRNQPIPPGLGERVRDALSAAGVGCLVPAKVEPEVESFARLFDRFDPFGFDWDSLEID